MLPNGVEAMAAIMQAVRARGLEDKDVQTQSFNIWPRYEYPEVATTYHMECIEETNLLCIQPVHPGWQMALA